MTSFGLIKVLARLNGVMAVGFFSALTVVVSLQVFTRFVLHEPLLWSEEVARYIFFWTVLLGAALSVYDNRHFVIDVLPVSDGDDPISRPVKIWRMVPDLTVFGFCALLLFYGIGYTETGTFRIGTNSGLSMAYIYAAIPAFAILSMIYTAERIIMDWRSPGKVSRQVAHPPAD
jgi:TRAP-type C4-dicarboxylate transport system permease small subunit